MKWIKKWSYLILLAGMGIIYFGCVDKGQVYAKTFQEVKSWVDSRAWGGALFADGSASEGDGESGALGDAGEPEAALPPDGGADSSAAEENRTPGTEAGAAGALSGSGNETGSPPDGQPGGNDQTGSAGETGSGQLGGMPEGTGSGQLGAGPEDQQPNGSGGGALAGSGSGNNAGPGSAEPKEVTYMTVEDDYFADAVFIGDSRTMGMFEYGGLEETAAFYCSTGLTVYKMFEAQIVPAEQGKISVEEALQQNVFSKIYFMIGINEMGTGTVESFLEAYQGAVDHLRELQPDAIIYLQAIIKVTAERSAQGDYINNEGIIARNEGIARMADNEHVFYLDVNPLICDESGGMIPEYTFDGVHLKAKYIDIWKDFLKSHAIALRNPEN
nr:GDSL-type esterase/lipase family protein [uncultured Acetatifactor sp.]